MLSHRFTLIGLGLCLKTTRSYLTKLKQLLLALPPPPSVPDPPLRTLAPPPLSPVRGVQTAGPPTIRPLSPPCPCSHVPLGGGPAPPSTFNLFRAHGSIHTSTGGGRWVPEAGGGGGGAQTERTSCRAKRWYAWPSTLLDSARPTQQGCASSSR